MVQMDGSHHDWFEGRRPWAVLMVMIDDATNRSCVHFFEEETTVAAMTTFRAYVAKHGLPRSLYVDRDSILSGHARCHGGRGLGGHQAIEPVWPCDARAECGGDLCP